MITRGFGYSSICERFRSGAGRVRTDDLRAASAALSQLSYGPEDLESIGTRAGCVNVVADEAEVSLLFFPLLLRCRAPQGFQTVVVTGLVRKDMKDYVEEV